MKKIIKIEDENLILNHAAMLQVSMVLDDFLAGQESKYKRNNQTEELILLDPENPSEGRFIKILFDEIYEDQGEDKSSWKDTALVIFIVITIVTWLIILPVIGIYNILF